MQRSNNKAEMGVGTLIIFIAILLVAAVAAGVIIQTAGSLQQQALATGGASKAEIGSAISLSAAHGIDGRDGELETLFGAIKLSPGSDSVKLSDVTLILGTQNHTIRYTFSGNASFSTNNTTGTFGVEYLQTATHHRYGVIQAGELISMVFQPKYPLVEGEEIQVTFIPRVGLPQHLKTHIPTVMTTRRVSLYT